MYEQIYYNHIYIIITITIIDFIHLNGLLGYLFSQAVHLFGHILMGRLTYRTQGVYMCVCVCGDIA